VEEDEKPGERTGSLWDLECDECVINRGEGTCSSW
jgi:hypothetical protein